MSKDYYLHQTGPEVQGILDRVEDKTVYERATHTADGLMSNIDKQRIDSMDDDEALSIAEIDELCI